MRHVSAANDFAFDGLPGGALEVDDAAFVQRKQRVFIDGIGAVVLLENTQGMLAGQVAQHDRIRLEMNRDVVHGHLVFTGFQVKENILAHDGEILVIDSERGLGALLRESATQKRKETDEASGHGARPPWCGMVSAIV